MPQVVAAAVAYLVPATAATAVTVGATAISYATLIGYAVTIGGSIAYGSAQAAKLRNSLSSAASDQGRSVMSRDPLASRRGIYGQVPVTGPILFMHTTGTKNEYLHAIVAIAGQKVNELGDLTFPNDEAVPIDGSGNATGKYAGFFRCKKHLGEWNQTADADLVSEASALWTSNHRLRGIAYLYLRFKYSADLYPNGMPVVKCMTKGKEIHDPREGVTTECDIAANNQNFGCADTTGVNVGDSVWGEGIPEGTVVTVITPNVNISVSREPTVTATQDVTFGSVLWSANSALCGADYLHDEKFGRGVPWRRINTTELAAEANICDEAVVLADASTEPRYTCNGTHLSDQDALQDIANSMAGRIIDTGGVWSVVAGAYRTPTAPAFTDDDLLGTFTVQTRQSMRETYNGIKGTFYSPQNEWTPSDFPPLTGRLAATAISAGDKVTILELGSTNFTAIGAAANTEGITFVATGAGTGTGYVDPFLGQDNGRRKWKDISLAFVTSPPTSQRVGKIDLKRGRQQIVVTALYKLKAFQVRCCDTILITRAQMGWVEKEFEVLDWALQVMGEGTDVCLGILLTLKETAAAVYDWNNGEETTVDDAVNTTLPDPFKVPTVAGLTLLTDSSTNVLQTDGTFIPRLKVTWTTPSNIFVESGGKTLIEYKTNASGTWLTWGTVRGDVLIDFILDVKVGVAYDVRAVHINQIGVRSNNLGVAAAPDYATVSNYTIVGDTSGPATPTGLVTTVGTGKSVSLSWNPNTEPDLLGYKVYRATVNNFASATLIAIIAATRFVDVGVTIGTTYWYFLVAQDFSLNVSSNTAGVSATPTTVGSSSLDHTVPSDPTAATHTGSGTYQGTDGRTAAYEQFSVPAMPGGAAGQNFLRRRTGDSQWLIVGQFTNTSTMTGLRIPDIVPGWQYDYATEAYNAFGDFSNIVQATGNPWTAPGDTTAPSNPTSLTLVAGDAAGVVRPAPVIRDGVLMYSGILTFAESTSDDLDFYEIGINLSNTVDPSSVVDVVGSQSPCLKGVRRCDFWRPSATTEYLWIRAVDYTGNRSAFVLVGDINSYMKRPAGNLMEQNSNAVSVTGGSITSITDLAVADGGSAASSASGARTNFGLGTVATQNANAIAITGGAAIMGGLEANQTTAVDVRSVNFRVYDSGTQTARVDYTTGEYYVQGVRVLSTRQAAPATLPDVIAVLQAHGLTS